MTGSKESIEAAASADLKATRAQGLTQLNALGKVVRQYADARNYAAGGTTSQLSPYLRRRLILEEEVLGFARAIGSFDRVEKFAQEVVWRTYWKGWLEARPGVWNAYLLRLRTLDDSLSPADRERVGCAITGKTDLPCFNAWCDELKATGYLHNHVRMWFASIWIFTLRLPWELGARFFLEHLLDGDPASNNLSWRWVAGLQTVGKHYLARADNIAKYTNGRWVPKPGELDESAASLRDDGLSRTPAVKPILGPDAAEVNPQAVLLHDEDCGPLPEKWCSVPAVRYRVSNWPHHHQSGLVASWIAEACADTDSRVRTVQHAQSADEVVAYCLENGIVEIWTYRPLTGFVASALVSLAAELAAVGVKLRYADRVHDIAYFLLATKGFFPFWEAAKLKLRHQWKSSSRGAASGNGASPSI